ncbi:MobV family relaxase [Lactococcus petauri]|uniref:MobV family relaxase n=1 Tax=Lactococcus petauri TaxID=1940789 RepID=UPI0038545644
MAYMVARTEKRKIGSLGGYQNHVDRKTENHSNKDIDDSKTHLNYDLIGHERSKSFHEEFMDYINENRVGSRAVRKDAVIMQDWLISSSQEFFDTLNESETKRYFETAVEFFSEKFGRENIRFATVHMDEKTPHMHMGIVPLKDGKLTAKTIFDRNCLRMIQNELPQAFQKAGFDIQRGEPKSEKVHLHPEEYKATMRAAQEKSKEIIEQAEKDVLMDEILLEQASYDLWEKDWDKTEKDLPDFKFDNKTTAIGDILGSDGAVPDITRDFPRKFELGFKQVYALIQEKFRQVQSYVVLQTRNLASKLSEYKERVNILETKEKLLERKLETFKSKEERFVDLESKLSDYKHELLDQMEPLIKEKFPDDDNTRSVLAQWRNKSSLEQVLSGFNTNFLGVEVEQEKLSEIEKEINDCDIALTYYEALEEPSNITASYDLRAIRELGFIDPTPEDAWTYDERVAFVRKHNWHEENIHKLDNFPWRKSAIEKRRQIYVGKKIAVKTDKTQFVSKLQEVVKQVEAKKLVQEQAKNVTRSFTGRSF